jgi:hypothetical protein
MMAAVLGGSIISIVLFAMKKTIGYQKPRWNKYKVQWVDVPPR